MKKGDRIVLYYQNYIVLLRITEFGEIGGRHNFYVKGTILWNKELGDTLYGRELPTYSYSEFEKYYLYDKNVKTEDIIMIEEL